MKILLLCWRDTTHPQGGGSERYLERVGEYLAAHGHEVIYHTSRHTDAPRRSERRGVHYHRAGGKFTVYPRAVGRLLLAAVGLGPLAGVDAIIDTQNGIPFFARAVSRRPTILLTHHCHREQWPVAGPVIARLGWFLESRAAPAIYRGAPYITVSTPSAEELVALGVRPEDIHIIRNGVDPVPARVPTLPREAPIHMITLSRLVPHKQIEQAIDVVAGLPDAHLDIVGDGWWAEELSARADKSGARERITFHGQCSEAFKHALLARADIHLMPSRKEGWGLAVVEAAQHGTPTIGYRSSGGLRDSIVDGETGLLADTPSEFARLIQRLHDDPAERRRLGEAARERARAYSWAATGEAIAQLLEEHTTTRGPRARRP
ncbi:glycosyltransferase family 4 protein [Corynebacterium uropygiale]|uniref:Glycosyltransferase family 4 protein n=1 Tax=Corynebacterium uropygiale TaxID=1775911 RepID=A0A9X1U812_9CORY|nr:glycosyltransferase family 4 protein [Corynebacterium uropygiale]